MPLFCRRSRPLGADCPETIGQRDISQAEHLPASVQFSCERLTIMPSPSIRTRINGSRSCSNISKPWLTKTVPRVRKSEETRQWANHKCFHPPDAIFEIFDAALRLTIVLALSVEVLAFFFELVAEKLITKEDLLL